MPEVAVKLGHLIEQGAQALRQARLPEPRREALLIWSQMTQSTPADTLWGRDRNVDSDAVRRYLVSVDRRSAGEPLSHVLGWAGFRHLTLRCDRRALIPRPETEGLVDLLLKRVRTGRVADIGTGTGCLALSLALEGAFDQVVAVDESAAALALARINRCETGGRVELVQADLCSALAAQSLDALISNPPYLTTGEYSGLDSSVRNWEPQSALVSGEDGLEVTARLLHDGKRIVRPEGWLAVEVDCTRGRSAAHQAAALGWEDVSVHVDLFGRERYLLARRSNAS